MNPRAFAIVALFAFGACAPEAGKPKAPPTGPFVVSDYFAPSGAMGDGATPGNVSIDAASCPARASGARGTCYSFQYLDTKPYETATSRQTGVCNWAGLFLQYPAGNWGTAPGLPIVAAKLSRATFSVAVAEGSELVTFQIGGIGTRPGDQPPRDACPPDTTPGPYFDQVQSATAPQMVGTEWQRVEIPIAARYTTGDGVAIETLIGALAWSVSGTTTALPKTIYVDDVVYE